MSSKHPVIAVTGSSGSGTSTVRHAFNEIFRRNSINAAYVDGESFYRYDRDEMQQVIDSAARSGKLISHFGPETNLFDDLENLFREYGRTGKGKSRRYVRDENEAERLGLEVGKFTEWEPLPKGKDLLFYEGNHGGVSASTWPRRRSSPSHSLPFKDRRDKHGKRKGVNAAQWVDLLIGVVPNVNLEWIQKIHRDCSKTGCTAEAVTTMILRRMPDYINFILPQFSITDINFQRVPLVDTSNPFIARDVPTQDESMVVIHFRDPHKFDFPYLMKKIDGAFMSRPNTMVVHGGKMQLAIEVICTPTILELMENKPG